VPTLKSAQNHKHCYSCS